VAYALATLKEAAFFILILKWCFEILKVFNTKASFFLHKVFIAWRKFALTEIIAAKD
jgi:hypothetical protein